MAAPNLAAPTTITGKTTYLKPANTSEADLLSNAANSGKALRLTSLYVANVSGSATADATVKIYSAASSGTGYELCSATTVPIGGTINVIGRESSVWIEEDKRIAVTSSAANSLVFVASYEDVS